MKKNSGNKPQKSVKKEFEVSDELKKLAEDIIASEKLDISPARVEYLLVHPEISKTIAGRCIRTSKELKFFSSYDYLIEISATLWNALDDSTRYILMLHELKHILPIMDEKTGEWKYDIRKHDVEDFSDIIKKHGIDWIYKVKLSISSLYDLSPVQSDKITI